MLKKHLIKLFTILADWRFALLVGLSFFAWGLYGTYLNTQQAVYEQNNDIAVYAWESNDFALPIILFFIYVLGLFLLVKYKKTHKKRYLITGLIFSYGAPGFASIILEGLGPSMVQLNVMCYINCFDLSKEQDTPLLEKHRQEAVSRLSKDLPANVVKKIAL